MESTTRRIVLVAAVAALAVAVAGGWFLVEARTADAHSLRASAPARPTAGELVSLERRVLRHDADVERFFRRHGWLLRRAGTRPVALRVLRFHRAQAVWARRGLAAAAAMSRPAHEALWLCIHANEQTPWGYHGFYDGGLQMGDWFQGHYAAGLVAERGDAGYWSPLLQMRVAESAYRQEGYSLAWLRSQWPTSYGCI